MSSEPDSVAPSGRPGTLLLCLLAAVTAMPAAPPASSRCTGPVAGNPAKLTGRVLDPSQAAVPEAAITLECGGKSVKATTDAEGRFQLESVPGSFRLRVDKESFHTGSLLVTLAPGAAVAQDVYLELSEISSGVTVTAGGFEQLVREAPASVTILDRQALKTKRVADLAQALIDVEGVDVGQNVGKTGGLTISMRGMPSDYTLMLIDGRRQNPPGSVTPNGFGETATSFMPPVGAIDRIEVVRGPMSTLYGSDAMGGVVNVITRKVGETWNGSFTADSTIQGDQSYGNTGQGTFYLSGPILANKLGLIARGSAFRRQAADLKYETVAGQEVPITSFGLSPTRGDIRNVGGRLSYSLNDHHEFYGDFDNMTQIYDNSQRQLGTVGVQGGYAEQMQFRRRQYALSHTGRFRFGLWDTSLTRNTTDTLGRTVPPGTPGRVAGDPRALEASNNLFDSKLVTTLRDTHIVSVGGQWWDAHMVDGVAPAPFTFQQGALFAEDEWRIRQNVAVTGGFRYNHHSTFGSNTSPRAYVVYSPKPFLTLKAGASRGFKVPQLNQLATGIVGFGGQGTIPLIGSPGLKPETSTSTEAGAALVMRGVNLNVTLFNNQFQDKIATGPGLENCSFRLSPNRSGCADFGNWPNVDLFGQSINVDRAVTRGGELSMRFRIWTRWSVQQNYTFTRSEQQSGSLMGQPLVNTPKHMYNATVRFTATRRLNFWARTEARSSRTRGTGAAAIAATQQIGPFKGYGMAHFGGGYQLSRHVTVNATVYNFFNTSFLTYRPYVLNNVTSYASVYNNLQEPRRAWVSLTYSF
ncbi:MAG: TonB-dependent receptor [Bryobacterales bacterium]|nr:TonB-dependent receptor [Bryobacterales bacterium]